MADQSVNPVVSRQWYQEPLLWLVIGLPLVAVLGSSISVSLAFIHADTVLGDGERNDELSIRRDDSADQTASRLGVQATLEEQQGVWVVHLLPGQAPLADQLVITLSDPHHPQNDQRLRFNRSLGHDYLGTKPKLSWQNEAEANPSTRVDIEIAPPDHNWRLLATWQDGHFSQSTKP